MSRVQSFFAVVKKVCQRPGSPFSETASVWKTTTSDAAVAGVSGATT